MFSVSCDSVGGSGVLISGWDVLISLLAAPIGRWALRINLLAVPVGVLGGQDTLISDRALMTVALISEWHVLQRENMMLV